MIDRIMRANYHLSYRMRHQAYKVTQERMEELERSLRLAGLTGQSAIAMRQAAWRHAYSWRKYAWNMFGAAVLLVSTIGVGRGSGRLVLLVFPPALPVVKLVKMYRQRATVPRASHRRSQLREHGRLVAARLRAAEAGLDVDAHAAPRRRSPTSWCR